MKMPEFPQHPASFRDPSGFMLKVNDLYYRHVQQVYAPQYDHLLQSGLYQALVAKKWLVPHTEIPENLTGQATWYKTLLPRQLPFLSYPCEWSPAQLKEAALLTLRIMLLSMDHGMILKDASPFNIQFAEGNAIFIDTLSFERYDPSRPWIAYRQFCENFLFPLYLHHYTGSGTHRILRAYPEGIPAAITLKGLPFKSRFKLGVWMHVYLPGKVGRDIPAGSKAAILFSKKKMVHLISHLESILLSLSATSSDATTWSNYYRETISSQDYLQTKEKIFRQFIQGLSWKSALDLGANDGYFSKVLSEGKELSPDQTIVAVDSDWQCIQNLYHFTRQQPSSPILPLVIDLADPTPASGFHHTERASITSRAQSDLVMALALVHHLALAKNIPLPKIAAYLAELTREYLIVEFIDAADEKSRQLLRNRNGWHHSYDEACFEEAFGKYFHIEGKEVISDTQRILYRMKRKK